MTSLVLLTAAMLFCFGRTNTVYNAPIEDDKSYPPTRNKDQCPVVFDDETMVQVWGNKCYLFFLHRRKSFEVAERFCEHYGGTLAMAKSEDSNEYLLHHLHDRHEFDIFSQTVWIGLSYNESQKAYTWVDGSPLEYYTNFKSDKYDNSCLAISPVDGKWQDADCQEEKDLMCEFEIKSSDPETTAGVRNIRAQPETTAPVYQCPDVTCYKDCGMNGYRTEKGCLLCQCCPFITCEKKCGMSGFRMNPDNGCMLCECDN